MLNGEADAGFIRTGLIEAMERSGQLPPTGSRSSTARASPASHISPRRASAPNTLRRADPTEPDIVRQDHCPALLKPTGDAAARAAGIHGFNLPADYLPAEQALRELRLPPYETLPKLRWEDVWHR